MSTFVNNELVKSEQDVVANKILRLVAKSQDVTTDAMKIPKGWVRKRIELTEHVK